MTDAQLGMAGMTAVIEDGGTIILHCDAGEVKKARLISVISGVTLENVLQKVKAKNPKLKGNITINRSADGICAEVESFL